MIIIPCQEKVARVSNVLLGAASSIALALKMKVSCSALVPVVLFSQSNLPTGWMWN